MSLYHEATGTGSTVVLPHPGIPNAGRATIQGAAHVPSLERPAAFDAIVLDFLAEFG